jgi:hypothetical protein
LNERKYEALKPREKPEQKAEDRDKREEFGKRWSVEEPQTKEQWETDWAYVDCKTYAPYTTVAGRNYVDRTRVYKQWRKRTEGLNAELTKPGKKHRRGASGPGRMYFTLVANGTVHVFEQTGKWCTATWLRILCGPVRKAMKKAGCKFLLRDGDPQAFATYAGRAQEGRLRIFKTMQLPPRSPDLNPCDFALWEAIKIEMAKYEEKQLKGVNEKPAVFWQRLEDTARGLSEETVRKLCGSMHRRVSEVATNGGCWIKAD